MGTRVTIRDVAKKAGVSISTVSRVLSPQINDYMREEGKLIYEDGYKLMKELSRKIARISPLITQ